MLKKRPNHGFFNNWRRGGEQKIPPQYTPCLPSSCSLNKFLQMSYKPRTNGALMQVLTLPKAEQCGQTATTAPQNDPCVLLLTPSLLLECGNNTVLPTAAPGGIETRGARERAHSSFFCVLTGKGFGRRSWQNGAALEVAVVAGGHAASLDSASNKQRAGFIVGLRRKGSYRHHPSVIFICAWKSSAAY